MIKIISFDIGGTLYEGGKDCYKFKNLTELVNKDYDDVRNAYKNIYQKKKGSFRELLNDFIDYLNIDSSEELEMFFRNKFESEAGIISQDKIDLIKELKKLKYKIILFSNTCCLFDNKLPEELLKYIDEIFYSFDLGYTKNEKESYKIIEQRMNCGPDEFLHIGDNLQSDYYSPIENGWNALYYGIAQYGDIESISSLSEVHKYLEKS